MLGGYQKKKSHKGTKIVIKHDSVFIAEEEGSENAEQVKPKAKVNYTLRPLPIPGKPRFRKNPGLP